MYSETGGGGGTLVRENCPYSYHDFPHFPPALRQGQFTYLVREQEQEQKSSS